MNATDTLDAQDAQDAPQAMKVTRGNPSQEELAAVMAVLLAVGRQDRADDPPHAAAPGRASWARIRGFGAPAGSWRSLS